MSPAFAAILGLIPRPINIGDQKIDGFPLETYGMVSAGFLLQNSSEKVQFFERTFLQANTRMEVVLEMFFFFFSNADF